MRELPVDRALPEAVAALAAHGALVLAAPPGSGKTTRLPPALLDAGLDGQVVVLEPRRVATRAAARRVAAERGVELGREVGYQVRHDRRAGRDTRLLFCTEGILVRRICADPFLDGVAAVVLDEFHERHIETDLSLAMLQEIRDTVRPDLKVVVMSATIDAEPVARFLGGAAVVAAEGRLYPVETTHLAERQERPLADRVRSGVLRALDETDGDVLVFLPGVGEIAAATDALAESARRLGFDCLAMHGRLPAEEQDRVLTREGPRRRVVLATNVAESSLTIEGISAVVDSGLARVLRHDLGRGLDRLQLERISRASARQRAGRAGRTGPGHAYQLWSAAEDRGMADFESPEIRRIDLTGPALSVRAFAGRAPACFGWFEAPEAASLERADELLTRLGAIAPDQSLSDIGRALLREPVHPRLGRVLYEAERLGCRRAAAEVVALLSERELGRRDSDFGASLHEHVERLHAVERARFDRRAATGQGVDLRAARSIVKVRDELARKARDRAADPEAALTRALLTGFPDRVARRPDPAKAEGTMVGGRGLRWQGSGADDDAELQIALRVAQTRGPRAMVTLAQSVDRDELAEALPGAIVEETDAEWDERRGQLVAIRRVRLFDLVLDEKRGGVAADAQSAEAVLRARVRLDPTAPFADGEDARALLARIRWLRAADPETPVPELGQDDLVEAAASLCAGRRSFGELKKLRLSPVLTATWTPAQRQALESGAPERVQLPSGRRARIDYHTGAEPFLAARLQEWFGMAETPRLAGGKKPLLLHLLAPNQRPVQITADLSSFWASAYPKIRSELRRRYPKHAWPDDPLTAQAESRPRRRRRN